MVNQMIQMNNSGQMGMQGMQSMQMGQPNNMMHAGSGPLMMPVQMGGRAGQQNHWSLNQNSGPGQHPFGKGSGKYNRVGNVGPDNDSSWRSRPMDGAGKNDAAMFVSRSEVTSSMKRRSESAEVSSGGIVEAKATTPVPSAAGHVSAQEIKVAAEPADEEEEDESEPGEADENEEVEDEVSEVPDEQEEAEEEEEEAEDAEPEEAEDGLAKDDVEEQAEDDVEEEAEHSEQEEGEGGLQESEEDESEEAEANEQEEAEDDDQEEAEDSVHEEATRNEQDAEDDDDDDEEEVTQKEKARACKGKAVVLGWKVSALDKLGKLSL